MYATLLTVRFSDGNNCNEPRGRCGHLMEGLFLQSVAGGLDLSKSQAQAVCWSVADGVGSPATPRVGRLRA